MQWGSAVLPLIRQGAGEGKERARRWSEDGLTFDGIVEEFENTVVNKKEKSEVGRERSHYKTLHT
jgi:hypothetical protein